MSMTRASVAMLAGLAVAGSTLMAPGVIASPVEGRAVNWGTNPARDSSTKRFWRVPVAVDTSGVLAGKTVTGIAGGSRFSCAVADGQVYCWGRNWGGQLGDGSKTGRRVPVAVDASGVLAGKTVTAIAAGDSHSCVVADGQVYCWGGNWGGQLGDGSTTERLVPVAVDTSGVLAGKTVTGISAGGSHTCAVADGRAYCWGKKLYGQWGSDLTGPLGNDSTTSSSVPVAVDTSGVLAGKTVTSIATGHFHTCAVADGQAYCWGGNYFGQLGDGTTTSALVPVSVDASAVLAGRTVTSIATGHFHTCAVADGRAYCWGDRDYGQLGTNRPTGSIGDRDISRVPVAVGSGVLAGKTVTAVTAAGGFSCAVADGQAYCWGRNDSGQLGNNSTKKSRVPVAVSTAGLLHHTSVVAMASSLHTHTLAIVVPMTSVPQPPTAPRGIKVVVKKRKVKITWKPLNAATSYRVRISKPDGTKFEKWKTNNTRVFKTKVRKGEKYRFQVAAVGVGGRGPTATKRFKAR